MCVIAMRFKAVQLYWGQAKQQSIVIEIVEKNTIARHPLNPNSPWGVHS